MLSKHFHNIILQSTGASSLEAVEIIQELWSGYGQIIRYQLEGCDRKSVVVKHVQFPDKKKHPRGWDSELSHKRKVKSYEVETIWYSKWADKCNEHCYIAQCFGYEKCGDDILIVLEDLDSSGYPARKLSPSWPEILACIKWLAHFHAVYMGEHLDGLWKVGTYWHLDTRPDELKKLSDEKLKKAAGKIDNLLKNAKFKTIVHGDAKLANFCFSEDGLKVAAVDFQYVGEGCGMKDLTYFVGSALSEEECESLEIDILNYYFLELKSALELNQKNIDFSELEKEWRYLYPFAWADFNRFLKGWSPGHWKLNSYSEKIEKKVLDLLS